MLENKPIKTRIKESNGKNEANACRPDTTLTKFDTFVPKYYSHTNSRESTAQFTSKSDKTTNACYLYTAFNLFLFLAMSVPMLAFFLSAEHLLYADSSFVLIILQAGDWSESDDTEWKKLREICPLNKSTANQGSETFAPHWAQHDKH